MKTDPPRSSALFASLRELFGTSLGIVHTRLALAGIEIEEEIQRILVALVLALSMVVFFALALLVLTLIIVLAFHDENREIAAALMCALYTVIGAAILLRLRGIFRDRPPIFEATLGELAKDREALRHRRHVGVGDDGALNSDAGDE